MFFSLLTKRPSRCRTTSRTGIKQLIMILRLTWHLPDVAHDVVPWCMCFCNEENQHILVNLVVFQPGKQVEAYGLNVFPIWSLNKWRNLILTIFYSDCSRNLLLFIVHNIVKEPLFWYSLCSNLCATFFKNLIHLNQIQIWCDIFSVKLTSQPLIYVSSVSWCNSEIQLTS